MAKKKISKITPELREKAEFEILTLSKNVRYDTKDFTIGYLVSEFDPTKESGNEVADTHSKIFVIPDYQRNSVWDAKNKSLFIESILLGLPIPFLFFHERADGIIEIVDGVQRVTTLHSFVNNNFKLAKLEKFKHLNGFTYADLSPTIQKKFHNKSLRIIVLDGEASLDFRQDLFSRVNRAGRSITPAEFRRGTFPGSFTSFIEKCSVDPLFVKLCPLSDAKVKRYARFELVLRFFAYVNSYESAGHEVAPYLDSYLRNNQDNFDKEVFQQEFEKMCQFVEKHFPSGFAKLDSPNLVPNVRFEAISVGVALALRQQPDLIPKDMGWLTSDDFKIKTTSDASNNPGRLAGRVEYVRDRLLGVPE